MIREREGPQTSTSKTPTEKSRAANPLASSAVTVLFPTPPLPDKTSTLFFTPISCFLTSMGEISDFNSPLEHSFWFGHPTHPSSFPALSEVGPGHDAGASLGISFWSPIFRSTKN
ncbi:hypothetical protein ACHWQZ_G015615 [Mnemiopsis leidyi]